MIGISDVSHAVFKGTNITNYLLICILADTN